MMIRTRTFPVLLACLLLVSCSRQQPDHETGEWGRLSLADARCISVSIPPTDRTFNVWEQIEIPCEWKNRGWKRLRFYAHLDQDWESDFTLDVRTPSGELISRRQCSGSRSTKLDIPARSLVSVRTPDIRGAFHFAESGRYSVRIRYVPKRREGEESKPKGLPQTEWMSISLQAFTPEIRSQVIDGLTGNRADKRLWAVKVVSGLLDYDSVEESLMAEIRRISRDTQSPIEIRTVAVEALGKGETPEDFQALEACVTDSSPSLRAITVTSARRFRGKGFDNEKFRLATRLASDMSAPVRREVAMLLLSILSDGEEQHTANVRKLAKQMWSAESDPSVQRCLAGSILLDLDTLKEAVLSQRAPEVRAAALAAFASLCLFYERNPATISEGYQEATTLCRGLLNDKTPFMPIDGKRRTTLGEHAAWVVEHMVTPLSDGLALSLEFEGGKFPPEKPIRFRCCLSREGPSKRHHYGYAMCADPMPSVLFVQIRGLDGRLLTPIQRRGTDLTPWASNRGRVHLRSDGLDGALLNAPVEVSDLRQMYQFEQSGTYQVKLEYMKVRRDSSSRGNSFCVETYVATDWQPIEIMVPANAGKNAEEAPRPDGKSSNELK